MYQRCLVCHTPFPSNESLEHFRLGIRVAYDPARGRLWAVCKECKRWSLAPIEERWEALDELEKIVRDRGRLLSQTENIALLRSGALEIVRVGRANLAEQSWWRYGTELAKRRKKYKTLSTAGAVGAGAAIWGGMATGGITFVALGFSGTNFRAPFPTPPGGSVSVAMCGGAGPDAPGVVTPSIGCPIGKGETSSSGIATKWSRRAWPTAARGARITGKVACIWPGVKQNTR